MSPILAHFEELLQTEHILAKELHQLMDQERAVLAANDLQALHDLQPRTAFAVNNLKDHAAERLQWMQENGLPLSSDCLTHPTILKAANIHRLWSDLEIQYHRNQALSATLAEVVLSTRQRTQHKLKILRGQENDPQLYNQKGTTSRLNQGQGYIQA